MKLKNLCLTIWSGIFFFLLLLTIHTLYYTRLKPSIETTHPSWESGKQGNAGIHEFTHSVVTAPPHLESKSHDELLHQLSSPELTVKIPNPVIKNTQSIDDNHFAPLVEKRTSWESFLQMPFDRTYIKRTTSKQAQITSRIESYKPNLCSQETVHKLARPRLPQEEVEWCKWALSPSGGQVVVGKSWGNLKTKKDKDRFDSNNCNAVNNGKNPSCDDSWGDVHMERWLNQSASAFQCDKKKSSRVNCYRNDNSDLYCDMDNVQINFRKVKKVPRPGGMTPSKKFEQNFLSTDCRDGIIKYDDFSFPHLYSPQLSTKTCDIIYNGTLLLYSHDDIRNLGHTLNDIMNIWVILWLSGRGRYADDIEMLNVDSFKLGHNFDDQPNVFFTTYRKTMKNILKGIDFTDKTVCIKHLLIQNIPPRFFIWESWFIDLPCSFIGPSTLYQRWNLHVRAAYGLLQRSSNAFYSNDQKKVKVLVVVRNEHSNMWGNQRTSRNYLNTPALMEGLKEYSQKSPHGVEVIFQELGKLSFEQQLELISDTSIMVGAHGAGMSSSMHMSVGSENCCGMIELYPLGEFSPIKGHGNMARKMGIYYDRIDVPADKSLGHGFHVPVRELVDTIDRMVGVLKKQPSCVHPSVMNNPYLEMRNNVF